MPGSEKNLPPDVPRVTLSAGIAFAHWKTPLAWLLEEARNAEHRAKNEYQRNALALSIVKRGGEILQWGAKFDSPAWLLYDKFIELDQQEIISGKFASALALYLKPYQLEKIADKDLDTMSQIITADFALVCSRQAKPMTKEEKEMLIPEFKKFKELAEAYIEELKKRTALIEELNKPIDLTDFPLLFLSASFLTRKKEEKKGE